MALEEETLPKKFNFRIWKRIGAYAAKHWILLLIVIISMLVTAYYDSSFVPTMNAAAIEAVGNFGSLSLDVWSVNLHIDLISGFLEFDISFLGFIILNVVMIVVRALAIFWTFFLSNYLSMSIMTSLRRDSFRKIQELPFSYFDHVNSGWLIARMNNDTSSVGDVLGWNIVSIFWALFDIIFTLITMFARDWRFSLLVLCSVPLIIIIVPIFQRKLLTRWRIARNAYSRFVGWLAEAINGAKTIKTMAIEEEIKDEGQEIAVDIQKKRWRAARINSYLQPLMTLIPNVMIAIIVAFGIVLIGGEGTSEDAVAMSATVVVFISFIQQIYNPLTSLSEIFSDFISTQAGAEKIAQLLDAPVTIADSPEVIQKYGTIFNPKEENYQPLKGDIEYRNVSFDYGNGVEVIHPLNLKIKAGTSVAIVGETGSGKTTIVNLLARFYEPSKGEILIDGVNYRNLSLGYLRHNIGYVQQTPLIFSASYYDNIAYGKPGASLEEVIEVAKIVGIHEEIMRSKDGYNTFLSDGGSSLSQGEKQLIAFARALIRNPSLLILDEATSSIDTETEAHVQHALLKILKGRTSISIAHRLSTIVECDRILVMDSGKIIEDGNHKSLMQKRGAYYRLYTNQFQEMSIESQLATYEEQIANKGL